MKKVKIQTKGFSAGYNIIGTPELQVRGFENLLEKNYFIIAKGKKKAFKKLLNFCLDNHLLCKYDVYRMLKEKDFEVKKNEK